MVATRVSCSARTLVVCTALGFAGCTAIQTPPARPASPLAHRAPAPADWFHHQLAAARHARATHLPTGDIAGAQRAYDTVMVPVCGEVAKSGPDKYRARCRALIDQATTHAAVNAAAPACPEDEDDSGQTPAQITACSD